MLEKHVLDQCPNEKTERGPPNEAAGKGRRAFWSMQWPLRACGPSSWLSCSPPEHSRRPSCPPALARPLDPTTALLGEAATLSSRERPWGHPQRGKLDLLPNPFTEGVSGRGDRAQAWPPPCAPGPSLLHSGLTHVCGSSPGQAPWQDAGAGSAGS